MNSDQFTDQTAKPTFSLQSLLPTVPKKKARNQGPRQQLISRVAYELGIEKHYLSGLYWSTKDLTDSEIAAIRDKALTFKPNPGAFFRKLVKEKREEIKKQPQ